MSKGRARMKNLHVFLLPEEYEMLRAKCDELGLSFSDYVRQIILFGDVQTRFIRDSKEAHNQFMYEINHIGGNINQIAHNTNINRSVTPAEFEELQRNLCKLYHAYAVVVKGKLDDMYMLLDRIDENLDSIAAKDITRKKDIMILRNKVKEIKDATKNHFEYD